MYKTNVIKSLRRLMCFMLVFSMVLPMNVFASSTENTEYAETETEEETETGETEARESETEIPETDEPAQEISEEKSIEELKEEESIGLEFLYYNTEVEPEDGGRWVAASIDADKVDRAVLVYTSASTGQEHFVSSEEIVSHYAYFLLEDTSVTYEEISGIEVKVADDTYYIDIEEVADEEEAEEIELSGEEVEEIIEEVSEVEYEELLEEVEEVIANTPDEIQNTLARAETTVFTAAAATTTAASTGNLVVVIDPGHGGSDSGAVAKHSGVTYYEKVMVLKVANALKEELEAYGGVSVYMTRTTDIDVSITDRVQYGKKMNADVLVSLHFDAFNGGASGAHILISSGQYRADLGKESKELAEQILAELQAVGLKKRNGTGLTYRLSENNTKYPNGTLADYYGIVRQSIEAGFTGLIIEHAFMDNSSDIQFANTDAKLKKLGVADATAIAKYYGLSKSKWIQIDGDWYLMKSDGSYVTGWHNAGGVWYYMDSKGVRQTDWLTLGSTKYYLDPSTGVMQVGGRKIDGKVYLFNASGSLRTSGTGWVKIDGTWYYSNGDGTAKTGWFNDGKVWYYLNTSTGKMATGWAKVDNKWYYLNGSGVRQTGWVTVSGKRYYLNGSGVMQTGWQKLNNKWYYFNTSGAMAIGWAKVSNKWYYMNGSGIMQTGWTKVSGKWYYLNGSGTMAVGWKKVGSKWYYLNNSGAMATGWKKVSGKWYYLNGSGAMAIGWKKVGSKWYYMTGSGVMLENTSRKIGSKTYYFNNSGACTNP